MAVFDSDMKGDPFVIDQNLDVWQNTPAYVPDALRHYSYQFLSSTSQAAEEKIAMLRENESLKKVCDKLNREKEKLLKNKDFVDKTLEALQKDLKEKTFLLFPTWRCYSK
ncbi:hypothetical protein JCGZ_13019 [Jatropha curcas]|uniref:Uncharacterized protein n=1 Tax=Jatropha curcas TaxID=180498 RepID=A0A067KD83_JATCU|nr:hypothetical protein JCGZ_13019 [Jatropha curcas]